tara:strand:+ start:521 stop:766 length:246 start_codon:yes stop_codon:yes gene_type:complete
MNYRNRVFTYITNGDHLLVFDHVDFPELGEVDNMMPGLAIAVGWLPYVLLCGPVFLFMKSNDRFKAKWLETHSDETQDHAM